MIYLFLDSSKLLKSLLENGNDIEGICEALDSRFKLLGNYKEVARHYGFNIYQIKQLETSDGPSRELIEWLACYHPDLKVEEFASVVKNNTKRNDIAQLLREFDRKEVV